MYHTRSMGTTKVRGLSTLVATMSPGRHPSISANARCNTACYGTTQISIFTLDQQEEMATVLAELRSLKV